MNQIERKLDEKFLKKICDTPSPSGSEQPVQRLIRERLKANVDKIETDVMGNVISTLNPSGTPRIMLVGHADEVGLQVRYISKEGFLYFNGLGGIDPHLTPGNRVQILTENGKILGVIGKKAIHLQEGDERDKIIKLKDQFIDIGARSHEEVKTMGIRIGDPIIFDNYYANLGNNGDVVSRCFDDKAGAFIVTEVMKRLKGLTFDGAVFGVTSVQEEVGVRGAHTASYYIHPTVAITYDVDFASDSPVIQNSEIGERKLGGGPIMCRGPGVNQKLFKLIGKTANELKIPLQIVSEPGDTGTDSDIVQMSREGVATAIISVPNRYMHSMSEVINLNDLEQIIQLSVAVIQNITKESNFTPK